MMIPAKMFRIRLPNFVVGSGLLCCLLMTTVALAEEDVLTFYTEHSPPAQFLNEQGEIDGASVRLIQLLQYRLNERVTFNLLPWARAFELAQKEQNTVLFETARTPKREQLFQWVGPIKMYDMRLYGVSDLAEQHNDTKELAKHFRACGYRGAMHLSYLNALGFHSGKNLTVTLKSGDCFDMVKHGRAEVIALNYLRHGDFIDDDGVQLQALIPLYHSYLYLAFSKDIPASRVERWQHAMDQSFLDGSMRYLFTPYFPERMIDELEKQAQIRLKAERESHSSQPNAPSDNQL